MDLTDPEQMAMRLDGFRMCKHATSVLVIDDNTNQAWYCLSKKEAIARYRDKVNGGLMWWSVDLA